MVPSFLPWGPDIIGVRQSRCTRLVTGLLKAWPPNPVRQFRAERINYHTNALPFNQIVIVVSIKDSEASFSLTESLPSERIHAQGQTDSQQWIGSQIGEREDELCAVRYFP